VGPAAVLLAVTIAVALVRPSLRGGSSPAVATTTTAATAQKARPKAAAPRLDTVRVYTVRAGDTLDTIARRTGVGVGRLLDLNPDVTPTALFIGQRIRLR
jgi:LysM repeat protein